MPRFALLEHTGAPDDPAGRHYDLLLEAGDACRTWRLAEIPAVGGPAVAAVEIPPHRLAWLDHRSGPVSGGRGFARLVDGGTFAFAAAEHAVTATADVEIDIAGGLLAGRLRLEAGGRCRLAR